MAHSRTAPSVRFRRLRTSAKQQPALVGRAGVAQSLAVSGATLLALAVLGLVLAHWAQVWLAPRPLTRAPQTHALGARLESAYGLFGGAREKTVTLSDAGIRLLGVVAGSDGHSGYAVLRLDAKRTVAVREGDEVKPGIRLVEVHPDSVVLARNGARETLTWPRAASSELALPVQGRPH